MRWSSNPCSRPASRCRPRAPRRELLITIEVAPHMRIAVLLVATLAAASVAGCNGMRKMGNAALPGQPFELKQKQLCKQDNKDYAGAQDLPPLKAPEGLETPNTRNALKVPPLNTPERVRG